MFAITLATLTAAVAVQAHMQLVYPPPFNASNNPHLDGAPDPFLQYPANCCGRSTPMPCRGYLDLLGTPAGASVATWAAGSKQNWNISGIGNHYGGSCQVGFSTDGGKSFKVATSYEGNCPHRSAGNGGEGQNFELTVPADIPAGDAVFAWTWVNREQEFNMNCAAITISNPDSDSNSASDSALASSPTDSAPTSTPSDSSEMGSEDSHCEGFGCEAGSVNTSGSLNMDGCTCTGCISAADGDGTMALTGCTCHCPEAPVAARSITPPNQHHRHSHVHFPASTFGRKKRSGTAQLRKKEVKRVPVKVAFTDRPEMLIADTNNGCETPKTNAELKYPNPGPDVVEGDGEYPLEEPTGDCGQ
ncbi:hypothetical protein LTS18_006217 [Coniosporium uncinatum]|uniref:Uncharacterized protein n=1 Tax=Coniosporium uncinatum TaxID=93489 RepID=A0ACC3DDJ3_9PEZI|nr:hypothetical protein LTS18_006217 [Coniosporium uncinatum]